MADHRREKQYAQKLVRLSLAEDGTVSTERVGAVLQGVKAQNPRGLREILRQYQRMIAAELRKSQGILEHAGAISDATRQALEASLTQERGLPVTLTPKENPALIAGVRVRIGDDVYDDSVLGKLERFEKSVN